MNPFCSVGSQLALKRSMLKHVTLWFINRLYFRVGKQKQTFNLKTWQWSKAGIVKQRNKSNRERKKRKIQLKKMSYVFCMIFKSHHSSAAKDFLNEYYKLYLYSSLQVTE